MRSTNCFSVITRTDRRRQKRLPTSNVASAALTALTVLGAFAFVLAPRAAAADFSPAEQQIANELPVGFDPGSCTTAANPPAPSNAVASLDCHGNSAPNAPTSGRFTLFTDPVAMGVDFQNTANPGPQFVPTPCPGADGSPSTWNYTDTPDQSEGDILCGTYQGVADVEWTRSSQLLILDVQGSSDVNALFKWWARNGNPRSQQGPVPNNSVVKGLS
jgi:hypothetical protein